MDLYPDLINLEGNLIIMETLGLNFTFGKGGRL